MIQVGWVLFHNHRLNGCKKKSQMGGANDSSQLISSVSAHHSLIYSQAHTSDRDLWHEETYSRF